MGLGRWSKGRKSYIYGEFTDLDGLKFLICEREHSQVWTDIELRGRQGYGGEKKKAGKKDGGLIWGLFIFQEVIEVQMMWSDVELFLVFQAKCKTSFKPCQTKCQVKYRVVEGKSNPVKSP